MAKKGRKVIRVKPSKGMFMDAVGIAIVKSAEERLLSPIIGNGTIGSGIVKAIAGFITPVIGGENKWTKMISTAFIVDSAEDFVNAIWGMISGATGSSTDNWN